MADVCLPLGVGEREKGALSYGLTTGFGPLADRQVERGELERLQKNLVYHLASGVGEPFDEDVARAMMACPGGGPLRRPGPGRVRLTTREAGPGSPCSEWSWRESFPPR
ncbi:hypothetical protein EA187_19035 [Lujinxingia sediminis]|uniref:Uncharacterized protein n=1 Tax=Lujinxingia sediminis TaxID=2480984 RepID=A0ABY0CPF8_9DELT|nr:hypothetical protein EA187_19035 [Lujinxingia sediminis]